jgi:hypothetical protein
MTRVVRVFIIAGMLIATARPALAWFGPDTWGEVVCASDAAVTVEVRLDDKLQRRDVTIVETHMNITGVKVRRDDWGYLHVAVDHIFRAVKALASGEAKDEAFAKQAKAAVDAGRFRTVVMLRLSSGGGEARFSDMMGLVSLDHVSLEIHPDHAKWWAHVKPMLDERARLAKTGKLPSWCPADPLHPTQAWTEKQSKAEAGWYAEGSAQ